MGSKRGLADGQPRAIAAWLGPPTGNAIVFQRSQDIAPTCRSLLLIGNTGISAGVFPRDDRARCVRCRCVRAFRCSVTTSQAATEKERARLRKRHGVFYGFLQPFGRFAPYNIVGCAGRSVVSCGIGGSQKAKRGEKKGFAPEAPILPETVQYWFYYLDIGLPTMCP